MVTPTNNSVLKTKVYSIPRTCKVMCPEGYVVINAPFQSSKEWRTDPSGLRVYESGLYCDDCKRAYCSEKYSELKD